jgi:mannose-6-phosphate isomerase
MPASPLIFEPIVRPKVWGGRRLAELLDKMLPADTPVGETAELADLESMQSVVARGPHKGRSLHDLMLEWQADLLGRAAPCDGRFPLLIKFLDARENLSIQVHPDPDTAARLGGTCRVKHEAWHILHAEPGALIYRGLKPGVTVDALAAAVRSDPASVVGLLNAIPVRVGQTFYLPSGTLHALGAGVVVAEIQTPSDITYRLYDWGRVRDGADAGLHVEQALASVRDIDPAPFERRSHVAGIFTTVTRFVDCPSFVIEKVRFIADMEQDIPYAEPVVWIVLEGRGEIQFSGGRETFSRGDVVLLPAALKGSRLRTLADCVWLEVTIPAPSDLAGFPRPDAGALLAREGTAAAPIPLNIDIQRQH